MGVERLFFTRNVQSAFAVGHARGVVLLAAARAGIAVREATPNEVKVAVAGYGAADKEQVGRMVATILGLAEVPTPDDAADALAVAICVANREREGEPADAAVLDRSAIAPIDRADSAYDRAVREALARDRAAARSGRPAPMIASVEGIVGAIAADSLVIEVGGIGYRVFTSPAVISTAQPGSRLKLHTHHLVREDQQALFGFRTADELGFFELLLTVTGVGPKVALAIVGSRPVADLQLAIIEQDQAVLVSIPGIGKKLAERIIFELKEKVAAAGVAARTTAGAGGVGEGEVVAALQALGYSLGEARDASRAALSEPGAVDASLEERVKAALRTLLRD